MKTPELSYSDFEMQLRKSYIKPRIERVSLVPEETVLGGCKISEVSGPGGTGCPPWPTGIPCPTEVGAS